MKRFLIVSLSLVFFISCKENSEKKDKSIVLNTSEFKEVKEIVSLNYNQLEPWLQKENSKTYIVNFWATWCLPCVKELPYFEYVNQAYKKNNVEVILVSLDFPKQKESRLIPYINKKKLMSTVLHLDDVNEQVWIAKVSNDWTGAIPATLIYNKDKRKFYEQSFTLEELENEIQKFIN